MAVQSRGDGVAEDAGRVSRPMTGPMRFALGAWLAVIAVSVVIVVVTI
jgi:hypothetical protein